MTVFHKVNRSGKTKDLSQGERDVIKSHLPEEYRFITEILYWSTGRIGEVQSIRVRQLVPSTGMVIFERQTTKTKTTREVYLPPELMNALIRRANGLQLKGVDFLLFNQSPNKSTDFTRPLSKQSFDKELRHVCNWNDLSGISSHPLRPPSKIVSARLAPQGGPAHLWSPLTAIPPAISVRRQEEIIDKFRQNMEVGA